MSANVGLALDVAAGVVIASGIFGAIWLGLSLIGDAKSPAVGALLILAALAFALWLVIFRGFLS
jgi:hypothetical protein